MGLLKIFAKGKKHEHLAGYLSMYTKKGKLRMADHGMQNKKRA
jgi:hypothetical protein